jgi:hypothetical protein
MNGVVKYHGRFALIRTNEGFAWMMVGPDGEIWYWHPREAYWTTHPIAK